MTASYATLADVTESRSAASASGAGPDRGFSVDELAAATGGRILARADRLILGAAVDSREVVPGNLFVALRGDKFDGHGYLQDAAKAGATAAIVDHMPDNPPEGMALIEAAH